MENTQWLGVVAVVGLVLGTSLDAGCSSKDQDPAGVGGLGEGGVGGLGAGGVGGPGAGGDGGLGAGGGGGAPACTAENASVVCNDGNPCSADTCHVALGQCESMLLDGVPANDQVSEDCQIVLCVAGVPTTGEDETDVPDDGNACTVDACSQGVPSHVPAEAGTPCSDGGSQCDGDGSCV